EPGDIHLRWTSDGSAIFVYRPSPPPLRVEKVDMRTGKKTLWKELRPPDGVRCGADGAGHHRAGRDVLRVLLPPRSRRALPGDRATLKLASYSEPATSSRARFPADFPASTGL